MRNFMSYGNNDTTIMLDRPGTTLIVGEDLDNTSDGKSANGTGKSSIINALSYALYDKPVSNISKDKLINNVNKKNMMVALDYSVGDKNYRIVRTRNTKAGAAGNNTFFYEDGKDLTRSAADTNNDIEQTLGIPHELFVRIVVFSASHQPFLDLPATGQIGPNQKDFIEELFGLTTLTSKAGKLKELMRDIKSSLETKRIDISSKEAEHERHKILIDSAFKRVVMWEEANGVEIDRLNSKLEWSKKIDVEEQKALIALSDKLNGELRDINDVHRPMIVEMRALDKIIKDATEELDHLNSGNCPFCKQLFKLPEAEMDALIEKDRLALAEIVILTDKSSISAKLISSLSEQIAEVDSKIELTMSQLISLSSEQDVIKQKISDMSVAVNPHLDPLDELKNLKLPKIIYGEVDALTYTLEHQEFLLKLLTKKDSFVRKALLDKSLPYLNNQLRTYLSALGLPHSVEFTHEMTASISRFGTSLDFGNLSNGQRARVNIALSFAFRNVLQSLHSTINICMLDEIFDVGLDTVGVQLATKLVKHKTREEGISMYIISHRDEVFSLFDSVLTVQYSKGFSTIVDANGKLSASITDVVDAELVE